MKIFACSKILPEVTIDDIKPLIKEEIIYVWKLYKENIIREMYRRSDGLGVILVLECTSVDEAKQILSELPEIKAGLIEFDFIPTMAFTLFEHIFAK